MLCNMSRVLLSAGREVTRKSKGGALQQSKFIFFTLNSLFVGDINMQLGSLFPVAEVKGLTQTFSKKTRTGSNGTSIESIS